MNNLLPQLPRVDLIHVARYLNRDLFPIIDQLINPGGFIIYHTFTKGVEAFGKPRRERFILQPGELTSRFPSYNVIEHHESVPIEDGRPVQFLVAQKPQIN
eukprot:TRINITY_DN1362_c0_g1_i1.p2 TRINITY_DN1362_c0_g1~~TRINITY_DN1362_c0_g1_i1.p2  ORF type:complete len:101 (+),score=15.89 TRINITY_DN1362_c0_g1_i1:636-938(+)